MSDFEDEEGVDEPVLDDENEEEGTEEEEVVLSQNISSYFLCLLYFQLAKMSVGQDNLFTSVELESIFKPSYILARSWSAFLVTSETSRESPHWGNVSRQPFFDVQNWRRIGTCICKTWRPRKVSPIGGIVLSPRSDQQFSLPVTMHSF